MKIEQAIEILQEFAPYEGCEAGEIWSQLADFHESYSGYVSEEFLAALEKEIIKDAKFIKATYKLETVTRTREVTETTKDMVLK